MLQRHSPRYKCCSFSIRKKNRNDLFPLCQDCRGLAAFIINKTYLVKLTLDNNQHKCFIRIDSKVYNSAIFKYFSDKPIFALHLSMRKHGLRIASIWMHRNQTSAIQEVNIVSEVKLRAFLGTGACSRLCQLNYFLAKGSIHNTEVTYIPDCVSSKLGEVTVAGESNCLTISIQKRFTLCRFIGC